MSDDINYIPDSLILGKNVVIEENVYIGENVTIGHNTVILEGTYIGDNVLIGANCVLGIKPGGNKKMRKAEDSLNPLHIHSNTRIGQPCYDIYKYSNT